MIQTLGLIGALILPLWNIPLIIHIGRRRSSKDINLAWTVGVFVCLLIILPSALVSADRVFKVFSVVNIVFFAGVVIQVIRYR